MKRENGWYQIKYKSKWTLGYWEEESDSWELLESEAIGNYLDSSDLTEINENRIKTPDEQ